MKTVESEHIVETVKESRDAGIKEDGQELPGINFYGRERSEKETFAIRSAIECLENVNSDLYQADVDINVIARKLLGAMTWDMEPQNTAEYVIYQTSHYLLSKAQEQHPGKLEGYGVDNIEKEAHNMVKDVKDYVDNALYMRFNGGEERLKETLDELNRLNRLQLEKDRKEDVEFSFKNHVLSYSVKDFGRYGYAVMADYGNKTDYVTPRLDGRQTVGKLNAIAENIRKDIGQDVRTAEKRMEKLHPEFSRQQMEAYTLGFVAGQASQGEKVGAAVKESNPKITDVQIILPVSKEYYITAKVNGKPMLRMPVTRAEAKAMAEGELDIRAVAERKYARQIELAEKKDNGMKR